MMRSKNSFLPKKQKSRLNAPPRRLGFDEPPKGGGWIWLTRELLESKAFRSLSLNACRALFRIACEHLNHAGLDNGRLKVTYNDFVAYGIRRHSIKVAIAELVRSGLVAIAQPGRHVHGEDRGAPTEFRLTWLPVGTETDFQPATNQWKNFSSSDATDTGSSDATDTRPRGGRQSLNGRFSSDATDTTYKILPVGSKLAARGR